MVTCIKCSKRVTLYNNIILIKIVLQYKYSLFSIKKLQLPLDILSDLDKQTNDSILILLYTPMKQTTDLEQAAC